MTHTEINALIDKLNLRLKWLKGEQIIHVAQDQHLKTAKMVELQTAFKSLMNQFYYETPAKSMVTVAHHTRTTYTGVRGNEWNWTNTTVNMGEWPKYQITYKKGRTTYERETTSDIDYSSTFTPVQHTTPNAWKSLTNNLVKNSWNNFFDSIETVTDNLKWFQIQPCEIKYAHKQIGYNDDGSIYSDDSTSGIISYQSYYSAPCDCGTVIQPSSLTATGLYNSWTQDTYSIRFQNTKPWPIKIKIFYYKWPHLCDYLTADFGETSVDYTLSTFTGTLFVDWVRSSYETINSFSNFTYSTHETIVQPNSKSEWFGPQTAGTYNVDSRIQSFIEYNRNVNTDPDFANHWYYYCTFGQKWYFVAQYCEYIS